MDFGVALGLFAAGLLVSCTIFSCVLLFLRGEFTRQWKRASDERTALSVELAAQGSNIQLLAANLNDELQRLAQLLEETRQAEGARSWKSPRRDAWSRVHAVEAVRAGLGAVEAARMLGVPPSEMRLISECLRLNLEATATDRAVA